MFLNHAAFSPSLFHHYFIHLISHTHTLFHFLYFLQIISCKCYITNSLFLRCSIGASCDKMRQEQKSAGTVMCFLLMCFRFYYFFASCRGIYCKWNLDVDVAAADSLSIEDVFCIALTQSHMSLLKRVHTPLVCIQWSPEARITHNGGIFESWLHILPLFFVLFDWGAPQPSWNVHPNLCKSPIHTSAPFRSTTIA